jgi:periplasmic protein TonB
MSAYTAHDSSFFSRRVIVFIVACAVQVLGFIGLTLGLANKVLNLAPQPIQTTIVQQVEKKVAPPPPPPPKMERPPVQVPPPEVAINVPVETNSTAITNVTDKKVAPPPPRPAPHRVVYTAAGFAPGGLPSTEDYYPPVSKRLDEQGTTIVRACPGPSGRLSQPPTVVKSSGSSRLDEAALRLTRNARYKPGTADGRPIARCFEFKVSFRLTGDD